jgi:hypothetical protein
MMGFDPDGIANGYLLLSVCGKSIAGEFQASKHFIEIERNGNVTFP